MSKYRISSEARNEYDDRARKIREAAAAAISQLDQLRSTGPVAAEALDAEVARIAQEKLHPYGCDLVVHRSDDGVTRFLIKIQSTGRKYGLIKSFFHRGDGLIPRAEVRLYGLNLKGNNAVATGGKHAGGRWRRSPPS